MANQDAISAPQPPAAHSSASSAGDSTGAAPAMPFYRVRSRSLHKLIIRPLWHLSVACMRFAGLYPAPRTSLARLSDLMRQLHPVTTQRPLIRLGPASDGGYLIPDDLAGIRSCFSPGVSTVCGFEKDCAARGMQVFMADASVSNPPDTDSSFHFIRNYIGATSNPPFITMDDWVARSPISPQDDLLLQMDIEGYEYEALLATSDQLMRRFRIIAIEFHRLQHYLNEPFFRLASRVFDKILQTHVCVHAHPNSVSDVMKTGKLVIPSTMEFTFYRKDRVTTSAFTTVFPHPLDCDNVSHSLVLPRCWYRSQA